MKLASCTAAALLLAAAPALAVPPLLCSSPGRRGFEMAVSVASSSNVDFVMIVEGGRELRATGHPDDNPRIARGFMDERGRLIVRIVSRDGRTLVAAIDVGSTRRGRFGTLRYRGRAWPISCRWDTED